MLRLLALLLVLANGAYFAWSHDLLRAAGMGPASESEPQRVAQQIQPQELQILKVVPSPVVAASAPAPYVAPPSEPASSPASAPTVAAVSVACLQAGPFDERQSAVLRQAAGSTLPAGAWRLTPTVVPAHWIVYMGKYPDAAVLEAKKAELQQHNVPFQVLTDPALQPGLSLGGYDSRAAALQAVTGLAQHGVHTARVVQDSPEVRGQLFVLPAVGDPLRAQLDSLKMALAGKPLQACP
ncbi:MAG: SPOR domain-containing protein [Rhodoferax sp.]